MRLRLLPGFITPLPPIAMPGEIRSAVNAGARVVFNLSGGKDSSAALFSVMATRDELGHPAPLRPAIHPDLGRAEWDATPAMVERIARQAGLALHIVRRKAGDLFDRWAARFASGKRRYEALETYNLIGPWSSASLALLHLGGESPRHRTAPRTDVCGRDHHQRPRAPARRKHRPVADPRVQTGSALRETRKRARHDDDAVAPDRRMDEQRCLRHPRRLRHPASRSLYPLRQFAPFVPLLRPPVPRRRQSVSLGTLEPRCTPSPGRARGGIDLLVSARTLACRYRT